METMPDSPEYGCRKAPAENGTIWPLCIDTKTSTKYRSGIVDIR
jgi:hypothetical protein